jgi:hypothetical protein
MITAANGPGPSGTEVSNNSGPEGRVTYSMPLVTVAAFRTEAQIAKNARQIRIFRIGREYMGAPGRCPPLPTKS